MTSIIVNFFLNKNTALCAYKNIQKSRNSFVFGRKNTACCISDQIKCLFQLLGEAKGERRKARGDFNNNINNIIQQLFRAKQLIARQGRDKYYKNYTKLRKLWRLRRSLEDGCAYSFALEIHLKIFPPFCPLFPPPLRYPCARVATHH